MALRPAFTLYLKPFSTLKTLRRNSSASLSQLYISDVAESFYSEEEKEFQKKFRKIIEEDINPHVSEWEAKESYPAHKILKKLGSAGLLGINKPKDYGGLGLSYKSQAAVLEEAGNINCGGIPIAIAINTIATVALSHFGTHELKEKFLRPTLQGDLVTCLGITESKDPTKKLVVTKEGSESILNGQKMWMTNGIQADWICLLASMKEDLLDPRKKSLFCVPLNEPGVKRQKLLTLGAVSSETAVITFDNVRIPSWYLIGEEGKGNLYQKIQYQDGRISEGILPSLGLMEKAIKLTIQDASNRLSFNGEPVIANQTIHFKIAELLTELELLRALTYKAVERLSDNGPKDPALNQLAAMARLKCGRLLRTVADECFEMWGGSAYARDSIMSRFFRDFRLGSIAGGNAHMMLQLICTQMKTLPKKNKRT